jgi:hypothetical protein
MSRRAPDGPPLQVVRFRRRFGLVLTFGGSLYLLVIAIGLLRHAGADADRARAYALAPPCRTSAHGGNCRRLVRAQSLGPFTLGGVLFFRVKPSGRPEIEFHRPSNPVLLQELRAKRSVYVEYWRGEVTAVTDGHRNREASYAAPVSISEDDGIGAFGMLYFALALASFGVAVVRVPATMLVGGGPGDYRLPYTLRPPARWVYLVIAAPALAWLGPPLLSLKASADYHLSSLLTGLAGSAAFAILVAGVSVGFAAWYGENRIVLTEEGFTYRTLFTSTRTVAYDDIEHWEIRFRRRSTKPQYVDVTPRGEKPLRLQLDMHWRRSREIVIDVLRRRAPNRQPKESAAL